MIASVALHDTSLVSWAIIGFLGTQTSQPFWSQERCLDRVDNGASGFILEQAQRQAADGEDLVGAKA